MSYPTPTPGPRPGPPPGHNMFQQSDGETGHPAVDGMLAALENAAQLPPAEQLAEYEAAHEVLRETLASIDG
ncbi:hypothetical protein [Actinoplanes sp. NPDC049265]|uniref:hypothetical protein n=1 Tax=Actinoplanes sp. NPDC049265 TaxID=3363902 RepID=UPI00371CCBF6